MIESFRDGDSGTLAVFYLDGVRGSDIPGSVENRLRLKLSLIDASISEKSLIASRNGNYQKLSGEFSEWSSIRVSIQWRLIFRWCDGYAHDLYLGSHSY